jgi:hypothetical protein
MDRTAKPGATIDEASIVPARRPAIRDAVDSIWAPLALVVAALAVLVVLGRDMTFYHDEFAFLLLRDLSINGLFAPHNEHLSATLVLLYRILDTTVGTSTYWPYLAVTFALHVAVASIVYVVVRREANAGWALAAMAITLMLGSGGDDILWAFQSGTIGAVAAGMAAIVVAPRRPAVAAILLTMAMATSGASLAFFLGTALHLVLTRPRALIWLLLPLGLYGLWYLLFATGSASPGLGGVAEYILTGLEASAAGALGTTSLVVGGFALLAIAFGLGWIRRVPLVVVSLLVSGVAFFFIAGLVRAGLGPEQATAPRYVYVVAPSIIIAGAILLGRVPRPAGTALGAAVFAVALVGNTLLLVETHDRLVSKIDCEKSMTPIARGSAGNPC